MARTTAISAIVGMLLLVGSPAVWYLNQPATAVGDIELFGAAPSTGADDPPSAPAPQERAPEEPAPQEPASEEPAPQEAASEEPAPTFTVSERRGALVAIRPPDRIAIPAIGVDAPIVPVAFEPDGTMEIPTDVATIGWFEPGVRPGQPGSAVLSGHVDSRSQGRGAFFDLEDLDVGDEVTIETVAGPQRWQVTARQRFAKDALPIAELFTREGDPRLVLITCGGEFDAGARSYSDNVVVVAVPV